MGQHIKYAALSAPFLKGYRMALERWISLIFLGIILTYGYTAWFAMDSNMAPFMKRNPIWPSTFPKLLSLLGIIVSLFILLGFEKDDQRRAEIDYRRLGEYKIGQAVGLLAMMIVYALTLRSLGFLISTASFLILSAYILGERKWLVLVPVGVVTSFCVWYLVSEVLNIYMRPWPHTLLF